MNYITAQRIWMLRQTDASDHCPGTAQITRAQHEALKRGELLPAATELPPAEIVDAELVPEPHETHPSVAGATPDDADRAIGPPRRPAWALDADSRPPSWELVTLKDAEAEANAINR